MSIRPLELGVMVQRMTEVDRVQQVLDQRAVLAQQQFGQALKADQERRETEVKAPPDLAHLSVNPDDEKDREGSQSESHRQDVDGDDATGDKGHPRVPVTPSCSGHKLDIKL